MIPHDTANFYRATWKYRGQWVVAGYYATRDGTVVHAAPILRWAIGKHMSVLNKWVLSKSSGQVIFMSPSTS